MTKSINCESCGAGLPSANQYSKCVYCGNTNMVFDNKNVVRMTYAPHLSGKNVAPVMIRAGAVDYTKYPAQIVSELNPLGVCNKKEVKPKPSFLTILFYVTPFGMLINLIRSFK